MLDRRVLKAGAGSLIIGTVGALIFNILHPRGDIDSVEEELELVADSGIWLFDHFMIAWSLAFVFVGLLTVARSYPDEPAQSWGRLASYAAGAGIAIGFAVVVVDGMALKTVADDLAAGAEEARGTAIAVAEISAGLFTALQGALFGVAPVLFGIAGLSSERYPKGLGYLSLGAGLLGLLTASIQYFTGITVLTGNVLFPIASIGFTIWGFLMGWNLWKSASSAGGSAVEAST